MEIENISLVSTLKWNCINDECLICNNPIGHECIKCSNKSEQSIKCMSILNKNNLCKHGFHAHCLQHYHRNNTLKCPMCNNAWY
jgi:hypothetical protein